MQPRHETPVLSSEWHAILAGLTAERERRGTAWCERYGVGERRRLLDRVLPPNVRMLPVGRSPELSEHMHQQHIAQAVLAGHCAACGGCVFSER
jgi:hypothetical protein